MKTCNLNYLIFACLIPIITNAVLAQDSITLKSYEIHGPKRLQLSAEEMEWTINRNGSEWDIFVVFIESHRPEPLEGNSWRIQIRTEPFIESGDQDAFCVLPLMNLDIIWILQRSCDQWRSRNMDRRNAIITTISLPAHASESTFKEIKKTFFSSTEFNVNEVLSNDENVVNIMKEKLKDAGPIQALENAFSDLFGKQIAFDGASPFIVKPETQGDSEESLDRIPEREFAWPITLGFTVKETDEE